MINASCNDCINVFIHFLKMGRDKKTIWDVSWIKGGGGVSIFPSLIWVRIVLIYVEIIVK